MNSRHPEWENEIITCEMLSNIEKRYWREVGGPLFILPSLFTYKIKAAAHVCVCAQTLGVFDLIQTLELKLAVFVACHSIDLRWCFPCGFFVSWSSWCLLPCGYKRLSDWRKTTVPYCFDHFWSFLICNTFFIFRWFNATKQTQYQVNFSRLMNFLAFLYPCAFTSPCPFRKGNIWSLQPSLPPVCYPWYRSFVGSWSADIPWELDSSLHFSCMKGTDGYGCFRK